jgi:hypothetical protein
MKKLVTILLLLLTSFVNSQNYTGLYVNDFKDIIGDSAAETTLLNYAQSNGFTYLILYNLTYINDNIFPIDDLTGSLPLANFIENAKNNYGILQVGAVGEKNASFDKIKTYNSFYPNNPEKRFDVFNLEFEYWNTSLTQTGGYYCTTYLQPNGFTCDENGAFSFYENQLMMMYSYGSENNILSETYIGYITQPQANSIAQNTHRVLVHYYRQSDVYNNGDSIYQYPSTEPDRIAMLAQTNQVTVMPIFSARPNHMYNWLLQPNPLTLPFDTWQNGQNGFNSQTGTWITNVTLDGYVWYRYSDLLAISQLLEVPNQAIEERVVLYNSNTKIISFYNFQDNDLATIYSVDGKLIDSFLAKNQTEKSYPKGIYIVKVKTNNGVFTQKLAIQ